MVIDFLGVNLHNNKSTYRCFHRNKLAHSIHLLRGSMHWKEASLVTTCCRIAKCCQDSSSKLLRIQPS